MTSAGVVCRARVRVEVGWVRARNQNSKTVTSSQDSTQQTQLIHLSSCPVFPAIQPSSTSMRTKCASSSYKYCVKVIPFWERLEFQEHHLMPCAAFLVRNSLPSGVSLHLQRGRQCSTNLALISKPDSGGNEQGCSHFLPTGKASASPRPLYSPWPAPKRSRWVTTTQRSTSHLTSEQHALGTSPLSSKQALLASGRHPSQSFCLAHPDTARPLPCPPYCPHWLPKPLIGPQAPGDPVHSYLYFITTQNFILTNAFLGGPYTCTVW